MRAIAVAVVMSISSASMGATPDYLPLKEGNYWVYKMSNGIQMATTVAGFAEVGTVRCAIVETAMGWQSNREYLAVDAQGIKAYMGQAQGQELRYDPPILRVKLPYREGDTWTAVVKQDGVSVTTSFQSIGKEQIRTQAGVLDCIKVRSTMNALPDQPPVVSTTYYADGIGPVRQVMQMGGQEITAALVSTNVRPPQGTQAARKSQPAAGPTPEAQAAPKSSPTVQPAQETQTAAKPQAAGKVRCPKCGAEVDASAKFCPQCGQKMTAPAPTAAPEPSQPAAPAATGPVALERYQSPDGRVLLYKPKDWNVVQGDMFGPGTYGVTVTEPRENAAVLFLTFAVNPEIKDSVVLAAKCIAALRATYPDLQATNIQSTPDRGRTITDLALTAEGQRGTGHGYFFHSSNVASVYILLAREKVWNELRPTLTTVAANLAYAPQGVAAVQAQGRQPAGQASATEAALPPLAAMLRRAAQQPGKQVPLQPAALPDQSVSLQIPQGWTLEGGRVQYAVVDDAQKRARGLGSLYLTIMPTQFSVPGVINAPYQPPAQALKLVLESGQNTRDVRAIAECPVEEAAPERSQLIQQMRSQGFQVDARLIHAKFRNVPTGQTCQGLFFVMCSIKAISSIWQVAIQGSWAPDGEYEEWLPLYLRVENTVQVNQQWMSREMQNQAFRQQQLNRNLQKSIAESNRAFDGYMGSIREGERSRDYTSHMWSQTTLGQGTWVAESEGAKVYQTDSWGIEGPEGRLDGQAYNTANFTGENPWTGRQLELVNTRAEYEKYIANR